AGIRSSPPTPQGVGDRDRMPVAPKHLDEVGVERPSARLAHRLEVCENRGGAAMGSGNGCRPGDMPDGVRRNQGREGRTIFRVERLIETPEEGGVRVLDQSSPSSGSASPPPRGTSERLCDEARPRILEDPDRVAARVLEYVTRAGRNFHGAAIRLPASRSQLLRGGLQVLDFEQWEAGGGRTMVRKEKLGPLGEAETRDIRVELVVVPQDLGAEDLRIVLQVPLELRRPDVEVGELCERRRHGLRIGTARIRVWGLPNRPCAGSRWC